MRKSMSRVPKAVDMALDDTRVKTRRGWRKLNQDERTALFQMMAIKLQDEPFDILRLAPKGSFLARVLRHFEDTDISYSMPLMATIMLTASWLTQRGACLDVPGVGKVKPTLWNIGLAESGSSKTLASEEIMSIFAEGDQPAVSMLPPPQSAPQWIIDLSGDQRCLLVPR